MLAYPNVDRRPRFAEDLIGLLEFLISASVPTLEAFNFRWKIRGCMRISEVL